MVRFETRKSLLRVRRKWNKVSKMAKGKQTKIQTLAKAVKSLQLANRKNSEYLNYWQYGSQSVVGDVSVINLSGFNGFIDAFGTSSNDDTGNKMVHKSFGMDLYLTLEATVNETDTTQFTMFLVSLRDIIGNAYNPSSGALSLISGQHYVIRGGQVLLNKKCFKIHKMKRITLTNHGTSLANPSAQTQSGTDCRFYWKSRPNALITNPVGDWKSMNSAQDPSKQYYLLTFSDNSSGDLQNPQLQYNIIHTVKTVA